MQGGCCTQLEVPKQYFDRYTSQGANSGDCIWENQSLSSGGHQNGFVCDPDPTYPFVTKPGLDCMCNRLVVKAQVSAVSEGVGNITAALKANNMWGHTVLVFQVRSIFGGGGGSCFRPLSSSSDAVSAYFREIMAGRRMVPIRMHPCVEVN
jgi:hypothetical protein